MTTEELLQWADGIVFAKTEKHLDSVQTAILEGAWQGLKYEDIAKKCHRSKSHIKNIAGELWQTLSALLGEEIHKANSRSVLERKAVSSIYNYGNSSQIVNSKINRSHINICGESRQYEENPKQRSPSDLSSSHSSPTQNYSPIIDLIDAPDLSDFYNRNTELNTLKQWILQDQIRLITIYGLSGIGKSVLTRQLIEQIKPEFDYIIWKSLTETPTLSSLKNQLQQFFAQSQNPPLPTIIDYFRNSRCLVILDDLQNLFQSGFLAGQYLTEHKDYGQFWQQIAKNHHQSCVILLSWEKPRELVTLQGEKQSTRTLNLKGLSADAEEI
ncbi:ATP-binding protein, partial [Planktothricoides raciborskii]